MNKIVLITAVILPSLVFAAEPSVYGAGNLDSENPYGLTPTEKKVVKNIKDIKSLKKSLRELKLKIAHIDERFEGIRSVTESITNKIGKIDKRLYKFENRDENRSAELSNLKDDVSSLKEYVAQTREIQTTNQEKIKSVLSELSSLIDSINSTYVSKDELERFKNEINSKLKALEKSRKKASIASKSGAELLKEAERLYKKRDYNGAKIRYERLAKIKYKPARSNFMLGEIAYKQKSYKKAIEYYKKSISLYDKASYIPTLLYHTGVSLSKLKKNKEAKKFFDALKNSYPDSKEAKSLK